MQIDFHHGTTYVAARLAGFSGKDADVIAHSAQYVDDVTSQGPVRFSNKFLYNRICSAHRMIDTRNTRDLDNHRVWIPFHFLPGNRDQKAGSGARTKSVEDLVCRPNSLVAQEMVRQVIIDQNRDYGLHRLGLTMHIYADTWAHQGFAGLLDDINEVEDVGESGRSGVFGKGLKRYLNDFLDDAIPPLGHGRALDFPDIPFLKWGYINHRNEPVTRDNPTDFCEAADEMCKAMRRYRLGDPDASVSGIPKPDMEQIQSLFVANKSKDGEQRHKKWIEAIQEGAFSFGPAKAGYITDRDGSWKHQALGTIADLIRYEYKASFLKSNWKRFHDALLAHRFFLLYELLPRYGICAA